MSSYYDIQLLEDLHNHFPEILYGSQFDNNPLVIYVRNQARNRYDLFTNARNNHAGVTRTYTTPRSNVEPVRPAANNVSDTIRITYNLDEIDNSIPSSQEDSLLNPLATLLTAALYPQTNAMMFPTLRRQNTTSFMEPVVVRPTQEQINNGSSIVESLNNSDNCAICQDSLIQDGRQVRRIHACHHMFHDNCVNTWFNNNVRCPTCRHDIRN
uniref:RING-type domain-containing protein n=1 Tax=viral metagenome TaxID=1070528 RepID=A0A6C0D9I0_9ZZZZ